MIATIVGIDRTRPPGTFLALRSPDDVHAIRVLEEPPGGAPIKLHLGDTLKPATGETFAGAASVLWTRRITPKGEAAIADMPLTVVPVPMVPA